MNAVANLFERPGDSHACRVVDATLALNTIEILLRYTSSELAWEEFILPALEVIHEALNGERRDAGLRPARRLA